MKLQYKLASGAALLLVGALVGYGSFRFSSRAEASNLVLAQELAQLRGELQQMQRRPRDAPDSSGLKLEVAALRARQELAEQRAAAANAGVRAEDGQPSAGTQPRTREEMRAEGERRAKEFAARLDLTLDGEVRDSAWGSKMSSGFASVLGASQGQRMVGSDCRTHVCKVTVEHDSAGAQRALGKDIVGKPPFDQEVFFDYDFESIPPRTVLYIARTGSTLAALSKE